MQKEILISVLSSLFTAVLLWVIGYIGNFLPQVSVPAGAVIAIPNGDCPLVGWRNYDAPGRVLIGIGQVIENGPDLKLGAPGGSYKITIGDTHLPKHQHETMLGVQFGDHRWGQGSKGKTVEGARTEERVFSANTSLVGDGKAIEHLPPYVPVRFCQKI